MDTSKLDEKQKSHKSKTQDYITKMATFGLSLVLVLLVIFMYFSCSGLLLFMCKIAQANVLPTEAGCFPYTDTQPTNPTETENTTDDKVKHLPELGSFYQTDIFFTSPESPNHGNTQPEANVVHSMKLLVSLEKKDLDNVLLSQFRNRKTKHVLDNYFIGVVENIMQFDYSALTLVMNVLNSVHETLIVAFGPLFFGCVMGLLMMCNSFYFVFCWVSNMSWFFKEKQTVVDKATGQKRDAWRYIPLTLDSNNMLNFMSAAGLVVLFSTLFFVCLPLLSFVPVLTLLFCTCSCFFYKVFRAKPTGAGERIQADREITAFAIISEVFIRFKFLIVFLFMICLMAVTTKWVGVQFSGYSVAAFVLCLVIIGFMKVFKKIPESMEFFSPASKDPTRQREKACAGKADWEMMDEMDPAHPPATFLTLLWNLFFIDRAKQADESEESGSVAAPVSENVDKPATATTASEIYVQRTTSTAATTAAPAAATERSGENGSAPAAATTRNGENGSAPAAATERDNAKITQGNPLGEKKPNGTKEEYPDVINV